MENFKIKNFDDTELKQKYDTSIIQDNIFYNNIEQLIFKLSNTNDEYINVSYLYNYQELSELCFNYDNDLKDSYHQHTYIGDDGKTFSQSTLISRKFDYEEKNEKYNNYKKLDISIDNGIPYLEDKDLDIYLNQISEKMYKILENIGICIIGFSGIKTPIEKLLEEGYIKEFNFLIKIDNKKRFIENSIKYLESKKEGDYEVGRLKELAIERIKKQNEKLGKKGNKIPILYKEKTSIINFHIILLLLHIEGVINIRKISKPDKKIYVDIIDYSKITERKTENSNNTNYIIKLSENIKYNTKEHILYCNNEEYQLKSSKEDILIKILCSNIGHYFPYNEIEEEYIKYNKQIKPTEKTSLIGDRINQIKDNISRPKSKLYFMKDLIKGYRIHKY